jgi:hypothetical protein
VAAPKNSDFIKTMVRTSQDARSSGWPGKLNFDPMKTVNDVFGGVMSGAGQGVQGLGKSIGDFSSMAQGNLGAVQGGLQDLGHSLFGSKSSKSMAIPRYDPLSSARMSPAKSTKAKPKKVKRAKKMKGSY